MIFFSSVAILCGFLAASEAAKILAIAPTFSRSHFILQFPLYRELAASGHEITVVSPFPLKSAMPNYTDVYLSKMEALYEESSEKIKNIADLKPVEAMQLFFGMGVELCREVAMGTELQTLLKSNATFDVIIMEIFMDECILGLGHYYNAPIIGISTVGALKWINDYLGNNNPVSYVPHVFLPATSSMSFLQRLLNLGMTYFEEFFLEFIIYPQHEEIYNKAFPNPKPSFSEARKNAVHLGLINSHFSITSGGPLVSNMIQVGGMHVGRVEKALPKSIEAFLTEAENGAIYFSLGSNVKPSDIDPQKRDAIIRVLLKRKEHIIWKWNEEVPEVKGKKNIYVSKWLPQDDILRHPKIKLFITHGGLLSTTETIYHGVPVVGIPFFGDQELNMAKAEQAGYGIKCGYSDLTEENLNAAIDEVINNKKYNETVLAISEKFRDRPMHPLDTAKYWVEYVIRHKGARHMRSAAMDLNWFQLNSFDTVGTILGAIFVVASIVLLALKKLFALVFRTNSEKTKKVKKN